MTPTTQPNPLAALAAAEASLVRQLDAATARVAQVGTSALEAALARYQDAAAAASERLARAGHALAAMGAEVLADLDAFAAAVRAALDADAACGAEPAPEAPALPAPEVDGHGDPLPPAAPAPHVVTEDDGECDLGAALPWAPAMETAAEPDPDAGVTDLTPEYWTREAGESAFKPSPAPTPAEPGRKGKRSRAAAKGAR